MAYITPNDLAFAEFAQRGIDNWRGMTGAEYLESLHTVDQLSDTRVDPAVMLDDLECDWMERGNPCPTTMCLLRLYDYMHSR